MAIIQSGATSDTLTVDPTSKAARSTLYDASGSPLGTESNPLRVDRVYGRTTVGEYSCSSFRTAGLASADHNLFSIGLTGGATVSIAIKQIVAVMESTAALLTVPPVVSLMRVTGTPTGGTNLNKTKLSTTWPSSQAVAAGATASDGGAATAITATAVERVWSVQRPRLATAVGYVQSLQQSLAPFDTEVCPLVVAPGEYLVVRAVQAATATDHYIINAMWEEFS